MFFFPKRNVSNMISQPVQDGGNVVASGTVAVSNMVSQPVQDGGNVVASGTVAVSNMITQPENPYYDRNPSPYGVSWSGVVAPHGLTTRASYTPAANKLIRIASATIMVSRVTAASNPDFFYIHVGVQSSILMRLYAKSNTVDFCAYVSGVEGLIVTESETLYIDTRDASVGGTLAFSGAIGFTIYDV